MKQWKFAVAIAILLGASGFTQHVQTTEPIAQTGNTYAKTRTVARYHTPTLLIHGLHAGPHAFDQLIRTAQNTRRGQLAMTAFVSPDHVTCSGFWPRALRHPLIRVVFNNNHQSWNTNARGLNLLLRHLKSVYGVHRFDAIAHSRGNLDLLRAYGEAHPLTLHKAVLVAVPANGKMRLDDPLGQNRILPNGQPLLKRRQYRDLVRLRPTFPRNKVHVLSIMGNIGNGSDGVLTNVSSRSLYPALGSKFASFKQVIVRGRDVNHHWLIRRNPRVINMALNFLWPKGKPIN
ncbi:alpha/beta hydrolase [Lacticaseibacillus hulanensis]|uniref:alpha/beta hydrolase n=1 Tax=Lacticaseibacillus hulanensis TaxID=2493111 RepID=UPI000FDC4C4D|nr:alpha/beta hydrolase [Lacticaseibacillus hulanensis]